MLYAIALLLICQLVGETLVLLTGLPVPGPVLGMLLLLGLLVWRGGIPDELGKTADALLAHFSLLFVPAGVGVMLHWERIQGDWLAIAAALLLGTLITLIVTAVTMAGTQRLLVAITKRMRGS
jgi:putative effector of murein hydrolase LrgA (UPF0299 family)